MSEASITSAQKGMEGGAKGGQGVSNQNGN